MKIGFIGAGKVGTGLGIYFKNHGYMLSGYYSKTALSAETAAIATQSKFYQKDEELVCDSDIIFITTSDDQIETVCQSLANRKAFLLNQLVIHCSGALSSSILRSAKQCGCFVYSLHPLQSFADVTSAVADLPKTVFSLEGDIEKIHVLEELLQQTSNPYFIIQPETKILYHAAACIISNYLVTLMDQGITVLDRIGINREKSFKAMMPLIMGTIKNIEQFGTEKALTGPIARGDAQTVQRHIEEFETKLPDMLEFYKHMGMLTLNVAHRYKLKDQDKFESLNQMFQKNQTD